MPRKKVKRTKRERFTSQDLLEEMILIEAVLGQIMSKHAKIKKDLHETRLLLFIILGLAMALFGLVLGTLLQPAIP